MEVKKKGNEPLLAKRPALGDAVREPVELSSEWYWGTGRKAPVYALDGQHGKLTAGLDPEKLSDIPLGSRRDSMATTAAGTSTRPC